MGDVGIVMPVYKQRGSYLRAAIRSVLKQSYRGFEFVIVLDGAPSRMERIAREESKSDRRVRIIRLKQNRGVAHALNRGFKELSRSKGIRYLTWVSSDNVYYREFVKTLRRSLRHNQSKVGLAYSNFRHVNENRIPLKDPMVIGFKDWQRQPKENLLDTCFIGVSFMYKRRYATKVGKYGLEPVEDYDYWLRLTEHCDITYVPKALMDYRTNSSYSISRKLASSADQKRRWRYAFQLAKLRARRRRGIPEDTTVLFPIASADEDTVAQLEALYDQYYSNFKLIILDMSPDGAVTRLLSQISDPRTAFLSAPSASIARAIRGGLECANTPFTFLYGGSSVALNTMVQYLRNASSSVVSVYMKTTQELGVITESDVHNHSFGEVIRTEHLKRMVP